MVKITISCSSQEAEAAFLSDAAASGRSFGAFRFWHSLFGFGTRTSKSRSKPTFPSVRDTSSVLRPAMLSSLSISSRWTAAEPICTLSRKQFCTIKSMSYPLNSGTHSLRIFARIYLLLSTNFAAASHRSLFILAAVSRSLAISVFTCVMENLIK